MVKAKKDHGMAIKTHALTGSDELSACSDAEMRLFWELCCPDCETELRRQVRCRTENLFREVFELKPNRGTTLSDGPRPHRSLDLLALRARWTSPIHWN